MILHSEKSLSELFIAIRDIMANGPEGTRFYGDASGYLPNSRLTRKLAPDEKDLIIKSGTRLHELIHQAHLQRTTSRIDDYLDPLSFLIMTGHGEAWIWIMVVDLTQLTALGFASGFGMTQKAHEYEIFHQEGGYKNFTSKSRKDDVHNTFMDLFQKAQTSFS